MRALHHDGREGGALRLGIGWRGKSRRRFPIHIRVGANPLFSKQKFGAVRGIAGLVEPWRRIWRENREAGLLYMAMTFVHMRIPESLFDLRGYLLVACDLRHSPSSQEIDSEIRRATPEDLNLLSACGFGPSRLRAWFERGARAWIIERRDRLLACYWLNANDRYPLYDWLVLKATPKDVWVLWWWVDRQHRGQNLAYRVRVPGVRDSARAGCTRMLGMVDLLNRPAVKASQKLKWKTIGRLYVVQLGGVAAVFAPRLFRIGRWSLDMPLELPLDRLIPTARSPGIELDA